MSPQTFIFIGRSGCGKGTQAKLLQDLVKQKDPKSGIFYLETGAGFRKFIAGEKYSNKLAADNAAKGNRQPDFLAVWMWSHILLNDFKGTEYAFFDGICRSLPEVEIFATALNFYNRSAHVIYISVSRKWSEERLIERGRDDDKSKEEIKKRLDWFDKDTYPAIEYFGRHNRYHLHEVNGEQSIEDVHKEILSKLAL